MGTPTYDVQSSFRNGQNSNDTDGAINNSYLAGVNVRPFGDDLLPRFPYEYLELTYPEGTKGSLSLQQVFDQGNPQAMIPFADGSDKFLIIIINGTFFKVDLGTLEVLAISYDAGESKLNPSCQSFNWTVIDRAIVVFDGDLPVIYNDEGLRRANLFATYTFTDAIGETVVQAVPEAMRSFIGIYDNLRLWLGVGSNVLAASDELGSGPPNAPLSFSQSFSDAGEFTGQFPSLGNSSSFEQITAMGNFISQSASFTGQMFVSTKDKIYTISSQEIRTNWESTPGFVTQILDGTGVAGQLAWDSFGYDLLYCDSRGRLNSLFLNQENLQRWSETNISTEVSNYIEAVDDELYEYTSVEKFSNLALQTANPYYTTRSLNDGSLVSSFAFKGFLALSRENLSGLNQGGQPAWAGLWEGVNPIFAVELDEKFYILSDDNGTNTLYVMQDKIGNDVYRGQEKLIRSRVTMGHFKFQDNGIQDKSLRSLDVSFADIESDFTFLSEFKATVSEAWRRLGCKMFNKGDCFSCEDAGVLSDTGGYLRNFKFRPPVEGCQSERRFRSMDLRLTMQGLWRLKDFRLKAESYPDKDTMEFNSCDITKSSCCSEISDFNIYRTFDDEVNEQFNQTMLTCCGECDGEEKEER